MPVSSAPILSQGRSAVARVSHPVIPPIPANDDCDERVNDSALEAALRHFAVHGLGAARAACAEAEAAWHSGERQAAENWMAICRTLDRRLADDMEKRLSHQASATV